MGLYCRVMGQLPRGNSATGEIGDGHIGEDDQGTWTANAKGASDDVEAGDDPVLEA